MGEELQNAAQQTLWCTSKDGVVVANEEGQIVLASPALLEMLGYEEADLIGAPVEILVPEERWTIHRRHRASYMADPHPRNMGKSALLMAMAADGREIPADISLSTVEFDDERYVITVIRDASSRHSYEQALREATFRDGLTELYNRAFLDEEIDRLEAGRRRPISILVADLDGLKLVNDQDGHHAGDLLIQRTADVLRNALRVEDIVARAGGDEFVAILPGASEGDATKLVDRLRSACESPESGEPIALSIGISVGQPGELLRDVLRDADAAMYRDKRRRRREG